MKRTFSCALASSRRKLMTDSMLALLVDLDGGRVVSAKWNRYRQRTEWTWLNEPSKQRPHHSVVEACYRRGWIRQTGRDTGRFVINQLGRRTMRLFESRRMERT